MRAQSACILRAVRFASKRSQQAPAHVVLPKSYIELQSLPLTTKFWGGGGAAMSHILNFDRVETRGSLMTCKVYSVRSTAKTFAHKLEQESHRA